MSEAINAFSENIARIFRNILPGFIVLIGANASHPSWFIWLIPTNATIDASTLFILGFIALVAGNTWYVFHRYGVHQIIDYLYYGFFRSKGPSTNNVDFRLLCYADALARHTVKSLRLVPQNDPVRKHVELRASGMHLMYIASEVSLLFSFWHESVSFFAENLDLMRFIGVIGFILTILQNMITRRIDWYSVELLSEYPAKNLQVDKDSTQNPA